MYKPLQKKDSSWNPTSIQKKGKGKPGTFTVQTFRDKSNEQQDVPKQPRVVAAGIIENMTRNMAAQKQEEPNHTAAVEQKSPVTEAATPEVQSAEIGIQRECADCAQEKQSESAAEGKDVSEMSVAESGIQTKLTVGAPGDVYEQEADRVAAQVMSMSVVPESSPQVQRLPEERWFKAPSITPVVQKRVEPVVQMWQLLQRAGGGHEASGDLESRLNASKGGGSALAPEVRSFMEPRFGADFSAVRVHTGGEAVQMNQELGAQAFAHGSDVYFGPGKSPGNNELTAHELTHVVQQTGAVQKKNKQEQIQPSLLNGIAPKSQVLGYLQAMQEQSNIDGTLYRKEIAEFQQTHSTEQILEKQQQLLPAQNGSITQTGDRSKIFRACGDSNAAGQITHETKFNAPDGSPKTRKDVGVGEEVEFKAPTAGKWTASSGTPATLANGNTFNWTAPNRAASVKIKFEVGGKESSVSMKVIEPDSITATKNSEIGYTAGKQGAGMKLTFNYHPKSVSFGNIEAKEVSGPATNITGYFKKSPAADLWHDSGDTFFPVREDNKDTAEDTAAFWGNPKPWAKGGWEWKIPNHFKVKTEGGNGKKFTTVTQAFSMAADGESTVTKAGESVTRKP